MDPHLKTPMYFFLQNFCFLEISFTSAYIPRFLNTIVTKEKAISYSGCISQLFFFTFSWALQSFSFWRLCPMTAMLPYANLCITQPSCAAEFVTSLYSVLGQLDSWSFSHYWVLFLTWISVLQISLTIAFATFLVSCNFLAQTHLLELITFFLAVITLLVTLLVVILSYSYIIKRILKFPSAQQKKKAFSTCSSHMIVITITYGSCIFIYIKPSANERITLSKGVAVLNTSIAPLLNPFIYTLRNQQVKQAFKNVFRKTFYALDK